MHSSSNNEFDFFFSLTFEPEKSMFKKQNMYTHEMGKKKKNRTSDVLQLYLSRVTENNSVTTEKGTLNTQCVYVKRAKSAVIQPLL